MITNKNCKCTFTTADEEIFKQVAEEKMVKLPFKMFMGSTIKERRTIHQNIMQMQKEAHTSAISRSERIDLFIRIIRACQQPEAWKKL